MSVRSPHSCVAVSPAAVSGIDFLRGIFSVLVVVAHALEYAFTTFPAHGDLRTYLPVLDATLGAGGFSVRGFFVVSGFCINLSVINAVANGSYSNRGYVLARATRIYPMYLIGLVAAVFAWWVNRVCLPGDNPDTNWFDWAAFFGELVMVQGFSHSFLFYSASWTLTSEVAYYIGWPFAVKFFGGPGVRTAVAATGSVLAVTAVIVAGWKIFAGGSPTSWLIPFWTVPAIAPLWIAGAWLAARWNRWSSSAALPKLRPFIWLLLPAAYALQAWVGYWQPKAWINMLHQYACIPAYLLLLLWFQPLAAPGKMARTVCRYLGELSYPLYLLHFPVLAVAGALLKHYGICHDPWVAFVLITLASLLVGGVPGVFLEAVIMRWRKGVLRAHGMKNPIDPLLKQIPSMTA